MVAPMLSDFVPTKDSFRKVESTLMVLKHGYDRRIIEVTIVMTHCTTHVRVLADHEPIALLV
jgi:hypothetical protein